MNKIIEFALKEVGETEKPANSNKTKYGAWFGFDGNAWCAMFISYVSYHIGAALGNIGWANGFAGCSVGLEHFKKTGELYLTIDSSKTKVTAAMIASIKPGSIVIVDWNADNKPDHVLFFESNVDGIRFKTIEGNTAYTSSTDPKEIHKANSNGGMVLNRTDRRYIQGKAIWYFIWPKVYDKLLSH